MQPNRGPNRKQLHSFTALALALALVLQANLLLDHFTSTISHVILLLFTFLFGVHRMDVFADRAHRGHRHHTAHAF